MRILVTDGDTRAALAVVRALGRRGHQVIVAERHGGALAHASRYCARAIEYPDPLTASEAFVDAVAAAAAEVDVLVPVTDVTTLLVTGARDRFTCAIPCAPVDVVARAADKVDVLETAARIGVPVPQGVVVRDARTLPPLDGLAFPLVIKPSRSRVRTAQGWRSTAVSYADSAEELARDLGSRPDHHFPVLLQERIVGPGMGVFALVHQGRTVALFSHRRLREQPPWGGVSVLSESVPVDPVAGRHAVRLLEAIGWEGVAMVEFKQDLRDGTPKLMEVNGRFWGSLQLAIDAGVDFPALLVGTVTGDVTSPSPYRVGIRSRWFWGDVDSLLLTLSGRSAAGQPTPGRARAFVDFFRLVGRDLHYDNPRWDDCRPFLNETRGWFRKLAGNASRRGRSKEEGRTAPPPHASREVAPPSGRSPSSAAREVPRA
jgi:predicted ATP-grasp superfamily ATP-dependent carboligase